MYFREFAIYSKFIKQIHVFIKKRFYYKKCQFICYKYIRENPCYQCLFIYITSRMSDN